jgi:hypothetical protein
MACFYDFSTFLLFSWPKKVRSKIRGDPHPFAENPGGTLHPLSPPKVTVPPVPPPKSTYAYRHTLLSIEADPDLLYTSQLLFLFFVAYTWCQTLKSLLKCVSMDEAKRYGDQIVFCCSANRITWPSPANFTLVFPLSLDIITRTYVRVLSGNLEPESWCRSNYILLAWATTRWEMRSGSF